MEYSNRQAHRSNTVDTKWVYNGHTVKLRSMNARQSEKKARKRGRPTFEIRCTFFSGGGRIRTDGVLTIRSE